MKKKIKSNHYLVILNNKDNNYNNFLKIRSNKIFLLNNHKTLLNNNNNSLKTFLLNYPNKLIKILRFSNNFRIFSLNNNHKIKA